MKSERGRVNEREERVKTRAHPKHREGGRLEKIGKEGWEKE